MDKHFLIGMDVGSTTVKAVVIDAATDQIVWSDYQRHDTKQPEKVLEFCKRFETEIEGFDASRSRMFVTGSGGNGLTKYLGGKFVQEVNAVSLAVEKLYPECGSVIELGGQDAKIIIFKTDPDNTVLAALRHLRFQVTDMLVGYAVVLVFSAFLIPRIRVSSQPEEPSTTQMPRSILRLIVACGALIFLYVGVENGVAGWLPTFATRIHGFGVERIALLQDTFWVTFLLGRFAAPAFLRLIGERLVLLLSILLATLGTFTLLLLSPTSQLFISAATIGLGCAAIMPTAIAILSHRLAGQSGSKLGFMFACAGLGAAVVPFCIGWLSSATNNLRLGMWVLVAAEAMLLIAHFVMSRFSRALDSASVFQSADRTVGAMQP